MALPVLPLNSSYSAQQNAIVQEEIETVIRYAMQNFLKECQHNLNQFIPEGSMAVAFRTAFYGAYLAAMLVEETERNMLVQDLVQTLPPTGGDWDRNNLEANDLVGTLTPIDHVRLLGKTTGVTG